jgi:hypothetical protein
MFKKINLNSKKQRIVSSLLLGIIFLLSVIFFFLLSQFLSTTAITNDTNAAPAADNTVQNLQKVRQSINENGPEKAWKMLISNEGALSKDGFHDAAHIVGQELFKKDGLKSLTICDPTFFYGCYHGVVEEYIKSKGISQIAEVKDYCEKMEEDIAIPCFHGLGHGFLSYFKYQLPPALDECHRVLLTNNYPHCYQGVFMEYITTFPMKSPDQDPFGLCQGIPNGYKLACFNYFIIYHAYFDDVPALEAVCQKNMSHYDTQTCIRGLGLALSQVNGNHSQKITASCNQLSESNKKICITSSNTSKSKY